MTDGVRQGPLSRRRFVRRTAELGLAAAAGGALAACAKEEAPREGAAAAAALGPMEKELAVYNWSDYIAPDTVAGFEREFGACRQVGKNGCG